MAQKIGKFYKGLTVVITGASSGIGQALAEELAPHVRRLILVARRSDRLEEMKLKFETARPNLDVIVEAVDLTDRKETKAFCDRTSEHYEVELLINNAGRGLFGPFDLQSWETLENMIELNVVSLTYLTHRFLPSMVKKGRGGIINISSGFGLSFLPGFAGYIATKHFVTGFTESLVGDVAGTGVRIAQVCPGPVSTEFGDHISQGNPKEVGRPAKETKIFEISAKLCAVETLTQFAAGRALIIPGISMKLILALNSLLPRAVKRAANAPIGKTIRRKIERMSLK